MAGKTLKTVVILRNDQTTAWEDASAYILEKGEVGIGYLTRTIDDVESTVVVAKVGNGESSWKDLPQIEGVFEDDQIITHNFGRHKTSNGYVNAGGKGMTTSEWILDALSEILKAKVTYPSAKLEAGTVTTDTGDKEIGSKITKFAWNGSHGNGSYVGNDGTGTYGTTTNNTSSASGITDGKFTWSVSNNIDSQTGSTEDGTFTLTSDDYIQIVSESSTTYAKLSGTVTLDASGAYTPLNNVGGEDAASKITGFDAAGTTTKTFTDVAVNATGFRKPFWAVLTTPFAETKNDAGTVTAIALTSADVRGFSGKGTATKGFPTTLSVAEGSRQVIFCAKAGTYSSVVAKDGNAQDATVTFSKIANAVKVEGANSYASTDYDVFEVTWGDPIASAKSLKLTWA